jgi:hypothetical protein
MLSELYEASQDKLDARVFRLTAFIDLTHNKLPLFCLKMNEHQVLPGTEETPRTKDNMVKGHNTCFMPLQSVHAMRTSRFLPNLVDGVS